MSRTDERPEDFTALMFSDAPSTVAAWLLVVDNTVTEADAWWVTEADAWERTDNFRNVGSHRQHRCEVNSTEGLIVFVPR